MAAATIAAAPAMAARLVKIRIVISSRFDWPFASALLGNSVGRRAVTPGAAIPDGSMSSTFVPAAIPRSFEQIRVLRLERGEGAQDLRSDGGAWPRSAASASCASIAAMIARCWSTSGSMAEGPWQRQLADAVHVRLDVLDRLPGERAAGALRRARRGKPRRSAGRRPGRRGARPSPADRGGRRCVAAPARRTLRRRGARPPSRSPRARSALPPSSRRRFWRRRVPRCGITSTSRVLASAISASRTGWRETPCRAAIVLLRQPRSRRKLQGDDRAPKLQLDPLRGRAAKAARQSQIHDWKLLSRFADPYYHTVTPRNGRGDSPGRHERPKREREENDDA